MLGPALAKITAGFILASTAVGCPKPGPVDVKVTLDQRPPTVSTQYTAQQLASKHRNPDNSLSTHNKYVNNSTTRSVIDSELQAGFNIALDIEKATIGCFVVKDVSLTIRYYPEIYIASDVKDIGCMYSAALQHEKRHVAADLRTLTDYLPLLREKIKAKAQSIGRRGVYLREALDEEKLRTKQVILDDVKPLINQMRQLRQQRQAEIDSPENHRRDHAVCAGVINQPIIRKQ